MGKITIVLCIMGLGWFVGLGGVMGVKVYICVGARLPVFYVLWGG